MKIFTLMVLLLLGFDSLAQNYVQYVDYPEPLNEQIKLNKISQEDIYKYKISKSGEIIDSVLLETSLYQFDAAGNILEWIDNVSANRFITDTKLKYNSSNLMIFYSEELPQKVKSPKDSKAQQNFEFRYDSIGRITRQFTYNEDTTSLKRVTKIYDDSSRLSKVMVKINNDPEFKRNELFYSKNKLSKIVTYDKYGKIDFTYEFEYNENTHSRKTFLKNLSGRNFKREERYNNQNELVYSLHTHLSDHPGSEEPDVYGRITKYIYNNDETLSTELIYRNGKVTGMLKHYYKK